MFRRFAPGRPVSSGILALVLTLTLAAAVRAGDGYDLDGGREAALITAGLLTGAGSLKIASNQIPLTAEQVAAYDHSQVSGFDRISTRKWSESADTASDVLSLALLASPAMLYTQTGSDMSGGTLTMMWVETVLLQQATVGLLKGAVGRTRPFVYNDDPRIPEEYKRSRTAVRSFPSGHTASAFAGAVFLGEVFSRLNPDDPARHWVRGTSLALACATGWLRIEAGKHFPTDVLAGAVIGALAGWGIPRLHEVTRTEGDKAQPAPGFVLGFRF